MFSALKKLPPAAAAAPTSAPAADALRVVGMLARQASTVGREAALVRGVLDDTHQTATAQAAAVQALARQVQQVVASQAAIADEATTGLQAMVQVSQAVQAVAAEVQAIVDTLRLVSQAAGQITQIALQTRLVAFNASVEAKRAGEAGRGFAVVADAVKDLAGQVEGSSKNIAGTVARLDSRIAALARDIGQGPVQAGAAGREQGAVHAALDKVGQGVHRMHQASLGSRDVCGALGGQIGAIDADMQRTTLAVTGALARTETLLQVSEQLIEGVAESGVETEDTPYIRAVQQAAAQVGQLLADALRVGSISAHDLFDDGYQPVPGSQPAQHTTRYVALAERLFPQVQERLLSLSAKVVFCIAADRNGYIACHNRQYSQAQRPGDLAWNTAHCRHRRIFNDRTGLASARNQRPFLLQTYRRDMGGGQFVLLKEAAAPIWVDGQHWGGVRLAFKF